MSNIISKNETAPKSECLVMSNQGTDTFFDLLLFAAETLKQTEHQKELIGFLKNQKEINDIAPGNAGFDLEEMPWHDCTLHDDVQFLLKVIEIAERENTFEKLSYEANRSIVLPWLNQFAGMLEKIIQE